LTDNGVLLSEWANDTAYENIFAEQLGNIIKLGDIDIVISGRWDSPNMLNRVKVVKCKEATTIGSIGFDSEKLSELADIDDIVPNHNMEQIEGARLFLENVITTCLRGDPNGCK